MRYLWDFYQVPKLSCFCELSTSSRFFCTKLKLHVEDDLKIKKILQGSNQMHKWSSRCDLYALIYLQNKPKILHESITHRYHLYLLHCKIFIIVTKSLYFIKVYIVFYQGIFWFIPKWFGWNQSLGMCKAEPKFWFIPKHILVLPKLWGILVWK